MSLDSFIYDIIEEEINTKNSHDLEMLVREMITDDDKSVKEDEVREMVRDVLYCLTDTGKRDNDFFIQCLMNSIDWKWMCTQVFRHIDALYGGCGICDRMGARNAEYLCKECARCPNCRKTRDLVSSESHDDTYSCTDSCSQNNITKQYTSS